VVRTVTDIKYPDSDTILPFECLTLSVGRIISVPLSSLILYYDIAALLLIFQKKKKNTSCAWILEPRPGGADLVSELMPTELDSSTNQRTNQLIIPFQSMIRHHNHDIA
jgi:hypothetical protein